MCGIAGVAGKDSEKQVRRMLEVLKHRGPDGNGVYTLGEISIGNVLLKITGDKKQPISNEGALTFNGEIYNFRDIAKKLDAETDSDSVTLFSLIEKQGVEAAIEELDGDYAFAYASGDELQLARDPAGVKPLYYGYEEGLFAFASEKKALHAVGIERISSVPHGHMLSHNGNGTTLKKAANFVTGERITDETIASNALFDAIKRAVEKRRYEPCAIAFSGGLDSSLVAALSRDSELYSVGMAGSHDILWAKGAALELGLSENLHLQELTMDDLESALPDVVNAVESIDPLMVSIAMPLYSASKEAHKDGIRVMLSGQGADELFGGYKRYESMNMDELEIALRKDLGNIAENNLERDDAVTMANTVELRVPYLDRDVVELTLRIDPGLKIHNGVRKYILRKAAEKVLPADIVWKEKKAAQYSSGIYSALEKLAKKNGFHGIQYLGKYLESIRKDSEI
jgi:asparagine synthase (glutamine-hydrolysing)